MAAVQQKADAGVLLVGRAENLLRFQGEVWFSALFDIQNGENHALRVTQYDLSGVLCGLGKTSGRRRA